MSFFALSHEFMKTSTKHLFNHSFLFVPTFVSVPAVIHTSDFTINDHYQKKKERCVLRTLFAIFTLESKIDCTITLRFITNSVHR